MTFALRDLQSALAEHLLGQPRGELAADLAAEFVGDRLPAEARLRIHRHHLLASLSGALGSTFATVSRLVGEDFFAGMARAFIAVRPPAQPVLGEYGEDFAAFIEGYALAERLPYLADVARLDWALNVAFNAPFGPCLDAQGLAAVPAEELPARNLPLSTGATLLASRYPLGQIWKAAQPDAPAEQVDLGAGAVHLLVHRQPGDSGFVIIGADEAAFLAALQEGASLEQAAEAGFARESGFDLAGSFPRLLALGAFAALQ